MAKYIITYEEQIEQGNIVRKVHAIEYNGLVELKRDFQEAAIDFAIDLLMPEGSRKFKGYSFSFCKNVFYIYNFIKFKKELEYIEPQIMSLEDWFEYHKEQ
jgi:hypothetical protein